MDRSEIRTRRDTAFFEGAHHRLAIDARFQPHHIHKPGHPRRRRREDRNFDAFDICEPLVVPFGDLLSSGRSSSITRQLRDAERRAQLVEPIVVAKPPVGQPGVEDIAALISKGSEGLSPARNDR